MFVRRNASRLAALTVPLVLAAGSLAGCSDGEADPGPAPSTSASSPAPSESESSPSQPVEPTLPAEAQGDDAAAAKAFVRHYFEVLNYAQASGDTRQLKGLALDDCAACRGSLRAIEKTYKVGGSIRGGELRVSNVRAWARGRLGQARPFDARATLHNRKQVISGSRDEGLNGTYPASKVNLQLQIIVSPDGWQMAEWSQAR